MSRHTSPTIDVISSHRSIRKYRDEAVPRQTIETLVSAAQRASTSSNLQLWSVVALLDPARRARMAELCNGQGHIIEAPVFLAWCADLNRMDHVCDLLGREQVTDYMENFLVGAIDAAIAAQTAAIAAESLGLGMCYIGAIRNLPAQVIELLELPRLVFPIVGMTVGWPATEPALRLRLPTEAVLSWETYLPASEPLLRAYDEETAASGIYSGRELSGPGSPSGQPYGWMEHSARRVAVAARVQLRAVIEEQGFGLK
jgi:FMN reductase (NADPH)